MKETGISPTEFNPYRGLGESDRQIFQQLADGRTKREIQLDLAIPNTIFTRRVNSVLEQGVVEATKKGYVQYGANRVGLIKFIQYGVRTGELTHTLPEEKIQRLTPQESVVFKKYMEGFRGTEIARALVVEIKTIESHTAQIMRKFHAATMLNLIARGEYLQSHSVIEPQ